MTIAFPSGDPANLDTLTGAFREIFNKFLQNTDGMLPARVISYTPGPPAFVQVQPIIQVVSTTGQVFSRAKIPSVPVLTLGGGGYLIHFPLTPGDLGWIIASDRDIGQFLETYAESPPQTSRYHDFSSALFIPDMMRNYSISGEDAANLVIQNSSGSIKVSMNTETETLNIKAENINITAVTAVLSAESITAEADEIRLDSPLVRCSTNLRVEGNVTAGGSITPDVP